MVREEGGKKTQKSKTAESKIKVRRHSHFEKHLQSEKIENNSIIKVFYLFNEPTEFYFKVHYQTGFICRNCVVKMRKSKWVSKPNQEQIMLHQSCSGVEKIWTFSQIEEQKKKKNKRRRLNDMVLVKTYKLNDGNNIDRLCISPTPFISLCSSCTFVGVIRVCIYNDLITPTSCLSKSFVNFLFSVHSITLSRCAWFFTFVVDYFFCWVWGSLFFLFFSLLHFVFHHQRYIELCEILILLFFLCSHLGNCETNYLNLLAFANEMILSGRIISTDRPTKHENWKTQKEMENFKNI